MGYDFAAIPGAEGIVRVVNGGETPLLAVAQDALDLIATARYHCGEVKLIVDKADVDAAFFDLKTRLAGEILQKFVNYRMAVAIVGDYSGTTSKSLRNFIYESNNGSAVFFVPDVAAAVAKLAAV